MPFISQCAGTIIACVLERGPAATIFEDVIMVCGNFRRGPRMMTDRRGWLHKANATRPRRTTLPPSGFSKRQLNGEHFPQKCPLFIIQCLIVILEKLRPFLERAGPMGRKSFLNESGGRRNSDHRIGNPADDFRSSPSAPIESICRLGTRLAG